MTAKLASHHEMCSRDGDFTLLNATMKEIKDGLRDVKALRTSQAVLEEQTVQMRETLQSIDKRLRTLELDVAQSKGSSRWVERVVWAVVTASLGLLLVTN